MPVIITMKINGAGNAARERQERESNKTIKKLKNFKALYFVLFIYFSSVFWREYNASSCILKLIFKLLLLGVCNADSLHHQMNTLLLAESTRVCLNVQAQFLLSDLIHTFTRTLCSPRTDLCCPDSWRIPAAVLRSRRCIGGTRSRVAL